jgi:hypothetical protein
MGVVAEQKINCDLSVEALRGFAEDVFGFG